MTCITKVRYLNHQRSTIKMETPKILPKGTTQKQWDDYQLELKNHNAFQDFKQSFANDIFLLVESHGVEKAKEKIKAAIDMARSMDRPNYPGYYRAAND